MSYPAKVDSASRACYRALIAVAGCLLLAACSTPVEFGRDPNTAALGRLTIGQTTEAEIRQIVGTPRGRGKARWSKDMAERDLLFYESVRSEGRAVELKMLVILLSNGRYDGHLWFSATDVMKLEGL